MLIQRPKPCEGESWPGYLLRLAEKNYINGISGIASVLNLSLRELMISSPNSVLTNLKLKAQFGACTAIEQKKQIYEKGRSIHLSTYGRSMRTRICSKCIVDSSCIVIQANWDRVFQFHCAIHQIMLLEQCEECKEEISYQRRYLGECKCGFKYANSEIRAIDIAINDFYMACDLNDIYGSSAQTFHSSSQQEKIVLLFLSRMFSRLENKKITSKKNTFSPDGFVVEEKMKRILVHFESWPTNFLAFISQQVQNHGKTPKQLLFENPLSESSKLKKVRLAIASSRHLWRRQNHGEVAPKMLSKKSSTDFVDRAYLIKHTGCTNDVANFWIEKGWLGSVNKIYGPNGGVRYKLPKLAVQKAINICFSTAFPKELADQIQIEESSLRSLVLANVLTPIKYGRSRQNYRLEPKEVFELVGHIFRAAMHIEKSSTCLVSFDKAISMLSTRSPRLVVNFIHDIKYGYLIAVKSEQEPIGIHQISIERAHLLTWIRGYFI